MCCVSFVEEAMENREPPAVADVHDDVTPEPVAMEHVPIGCVGKAHRRC